MAIEGVHCLARKKSSGLVRVTAYKPTGVKPGLQVTPTNKIYRLYQACACEAFGPANGCEVCGGILAAAFQRASVLLTKFREKPLS